MFYTSSAKYLKCQQTYNLSLFQQNIAFVSNIYFCETGLTNKRNYGNIQTEHVSLFTYYFVFVVPVHQHFALIQYKRDSLLNNQILIFQRWHKLTISRHNFTIWKIRDLLVLISVAINWLKNTCQSTKNIFIMYLKWCQNLFNLHDN